jgi:ABC-type transport system involved in multi-copper enzyme maturation permease subunit
MSDVLVIARMAWQEAVRRRVLLVVAVLTVGSGALYLIGCFSVKNHVGGLVQIGSGQLDPIVPATLLGLSSFATLFLGSVLAVFLTAGSVRGDADRGLVQPLVVRPVGRPVYLAGRALAAMAVASTYVLVISVLATLVNGWIFDDPPPERWAAIPALVAAVCVVTVLTLLVSCLLSTVATGISVLMAYGAGLVAGLLGEIGRSFQAPTLTHIADAVCYALPFEALYRDALSKLAPSGLIGKIVQLGPLGGAHSGGPALWIYVVAYVGGCAAAAIAVFGRSDL